MLRSSHFWIVSFLFVVANTHEFKYLPFDVSWMSAKDQAELSKVETPQRGRFLTAVYDKADAEGKSAIRKEVVPSCYASWMNKEDREELESLHESGNHDKCKKRVHELLDKLPEEKQTEVRSYWSFCEHVWYESHEHVHHAGHHHHSKRHSGRYTRHSESGYDSFAAEHLTWMSEEERAEVKNLHGESKEKARARVFELFDSATGEKREKAISQLQGACRELIVHTFGEETATSLRQMKESGSTNEEMKKKIGELLNGVTDETKKAKVLEYQDACEKIYKATGSGDRRRRQTHHHGLESKLKSEWKWLTDEQKEEIRSLKNQGKNDEFLLSRVFEFFKSAESKDAAEDGLQQSCGGAILTILGPEKAQLLKEFMADGAKPEVYEAKVKELLNQQDKEGSRRSLSKNQENCKLVFTAASRRRRNHHEHTLEHYLNKHLSWLTDEQKSTLRKLHEEDKDEDKLHKKVMEWYDETTGEKKEQAESALRAGCRDILMSVIGPEKMEEVKKLKESGNSPTDLSAKVEELIKGVSDEAKVKRVRKYDVQCKKLFGVGSSRRRRDDHSHKTMEDYLTTHLIWLTDAQKEEVRQMKANGKSRDEIHAKVMDFFDSATGEVKQKATSELQASCHELYDKYLSTEQMEELKKLKQSGASKEDLKTKGDEFVSKVPDPAKRKDAEFYSDGCRKVFGVDRKRRHHLRFDQ